MKLLPDIKDEENQREGWVLNERRFRAKGSTAPSVAKPGKRAPDPCGDRYLTSSALLGPLSEPACDHMVDMRL